VTSFFDRFLRKKPPAQPMRDVAGLTSHLAVRALRLTPSDRPARSHFGGHPGLPAGVWPSHQGTPLGFMARLSLAEIHAVERISWLPESGALLFFYDVEEQPWGYDPGDRGRWAVLHVDDLKSPASEAGSGKTPSKPFRYVEFGSIQSFPSWERDEVATLNLTEPESEELMRITDAPFSGGRKHQVGGFPSPIQSDEMELEAQLVSHGMYLGNDSGDKTQRAALAPGAADWRLLLQLDSDEHLDWMWGDAGTLYFWVREQAARRGDFSDVWLVLQCY
jgi:uncharacterized protein YwqG